MMTEKQQAENDRMRAASGEVNDTRPLVAFLYLLLQSGDLISGELEDVLDEQMDLTASEYQFANGWLASYAQDIADRLLRPSAPLIDPEARKDCGER